MELRRQISVLRAWIWLLLGSVVLAAGAAYLVSINLPKVYEGRVTLIVGQSTQATNPDLNQLLASQRLSQTYAELATTGPLLQEVIAKNGLGVSVDDFSDASAPMRRETPSSSTWSSRTVIRLGRPRSRIPSPTR